jgi:hypothetical protein
VADVTVCRWSPLDETGSIHVSDDTPAGTHAIRITGTGV